MSNNLKFEQYHLSEFRAIWLNVLGIGSLLILCAYGGLVVFAYYYDARCDPLEVKVG